MNRVVLDFLSWLDGQRLQAEQVQSRDVLGFIKYKQSREVQQATIKTYVQAIKLFCNYQIKYNNQRTNPARHIKIQGVKRRKLYHIFSPEELHRLYNGYEKKEGDLIAARNKLMLGLYVYQGIQTAELVKMELSHIRLREGLVEIPSTKRSNTRILQLESHQVMDVYDYVLQARKEILDISKQQTESLLVSPKGGKDKTNYVTSLFKQLKKQNNKVINAQQLRTSVIVKWLKQYNLREAQYRAGHKYVSSTESYLVNEMEGLSEEVSKFHPLG